MEQRGMNIELAAAMPWLTAEGDSFWEIDGTYPKGGSATSCIARVVPHVMTGGGEPLFEVLTYGGGSVIPASRVTRATRLLLVLADDPRTAYYVNDQTELDAATERSV